MSNPLNGAAFVRYSTYSGTYPLTSGPISVVGSYATPTTTSYAANTYNNFFNLSFLGACESARTAIDVIVTPAPALTPATSTQTVCANTPTTISFSGYPDLSVNPAATATVNGQDITFTPATTTTYTITGNDPVTGCNNTATVTLTVTPLAGGTASANATNFCGSTASPVLTLTGNTGAVGGFVWQQSATGLAGSFADISGSANQSPFNAPAISTTTYYQAVSSCGVNTASSNILTITVSDPQVVATNSPVTRCGTGSVTLTATPTAGSTIRWYDSNTSAIPLATGNTYSPTVTSSRQFFAAAVENPETVGRPVPGSTSNAIAQGLGLVFNAANAFTLNSVDIYPAGSAVTITIQVQNSAGSLITGLSTTYNLPAGNGTTPVTIPLNFAIPAGTGMRLVATSTQPLVREPSIGGFPYNSPSGNVIITGGYNGTVPTSSTYFYFYNWQISGPCASSRTAVQVNVTTPPALTPATTATAICNGSSTTIAYTGYANLSVSPATGAIVNGTSITFNPTTTTTYTITGDDGTGPSGCTATATATITVNPVPDAPTLTPATPASICLGGNVVVAASSNTMLATRIVLDENFNASPTGWVIAEKSTRGGSRPGALLRFTRPSNPYSYTDLLTNYSIDGTRFVIANADTGGNNSVTRTRLISPTFNLAGLTSASLNFQQYFNFFSTGNSANIDISTDGGATWTLNILEQRTVDVGSATTPAATTVNLDAYAGQTNVKVRFRYRSAWGYYWAIDNVQIRGQYIDSPTFAVSPATGATVNGSNITFNPTATTTYQVTATFPSSPDCPSPATPITITVNDLPTVTLSNNGPVCGTNPGAVTGNLTGTEPFTINYTINGVAQQPLQVAGTNTFTLNTGPLATNATYTITSLTDANSCSATDLTAATSTVVVNPVPTVSLSNNGPVCPGGSTTVTGNLTGTAPFSITYTLNGVAQPVITTSSNQFTIATGNLSANAAYVITALSDANCAATNLTDATTTVVVNPVPTVTLSNNGPVCGSASATVTGNLTGTGPFSITYTINGVTQPVLTSASNQFSIATGALTANATYTVTALTDANCAATNLTAATTTVVANPLPTVTLSNNGPVCGNASATITGNLTGTAPFNITYTTNGGNPQTITASSNQFTFATGALTANATYAVTALSDANCTATSFGAAASTTVIANPLPTVSLSNNGPVCANSTATITGTLTGTAPFSITYTTNGVNPQTITATSTQFTITTAALTANTTIEITNLSDANCSASTFTSAATTTVAVNARPTVVLTNSGPLCPGNAGTITGTLTGTGPFSITYTVNGGTPVTISETSTRFFIATGNLTTSTTYAVTALSDLNCSATTLTGATTTIVVNPEPTVTLSNNGPVCTGATGTVTGTLTGTAPFIINYNVNGGGTQSLFTNSNQFTITTQALTADATYTITDLLDANCSASSFPVATTTITVRPAPAVAITNNGPICANTTATISGTLTGTAPFSITYTINNINPTTITSSTNSFSFTSAALTANTTFRVIALSDANCSTFPANAVTTVTVNPEPTVTLTNNGPVCGSGSPTVTGTLTGSAPFTITYTTNGANPQTIVTNNPTFTIPTGTLTSNTTYAITGLTDATCSATTFPATSVTTVVVTEVTIWTGNLNTSWFIVDNWTNCLPSPTVSAIIPAGRSNYPSITGGNATVKTLTIEAGGELRQSGGTLNIFGDLINNTAPVNIALTNGTVTILGSVSQTITGSQSTDFLNLRVNKPGGNLTLGIDQTVRGFLTMSSGILNTGSFKVTLGSSAIISESDNSYLLGILETTRTLGAASTTYTFGEMGFELTLPNNSGLPGVTLLRRVTGTQFAIGATASTIARYFQVQAANGNVRADITFKYLTPELRGQNENALKLYNSANQGTTWTVRAGSSVNPATNTILSGNPIVQEINLWWSASDNLTPLPVELVSFTAVKRENNALLNWSTASETDSKGFEVEVSTNGREFRQIGFVESRNGSSMQYYTFTDLENGKSGIRYYRLKQVDLNGDFAYSEIKALTFGNRNQLVDVYPNPFNSEVNLAIQALTAETATVTVTDMVGKTVLIKKVKVEAGANKVKLQPAHNLPAGAYLITIDLGGERFTSKLLKQY